MFRQILIPSTGETSDDVVFATARAAAGDHPAHLGFLFAKQDPADAAIAMSGGAMDGGFGIAAMIETLEKESEVAEAAARRAWAAFCVTAQLQVTHSPQSHGVSTTLETVSGNEARLLVQHGRTSDLLVIGRPRGGEAVALGRLQDVLSGIGRPMLIAGPSSPDTLIRTIVIAWKDTAEAARAVCAAMPFIARAERILVMTAGEEATSVGMAHDATRASASRLVATLLGHAPLVHAQHVPLGHGSPAQALLAAAMEARASLLVMGGYGHGELRETLFGGFTRTVLGGAELPVLMMR